MKILIKMILIKKYYKMKDKIKFKDLSIPLQISIISAYIAITIFLLAFLSGFLKAIMQ